MPHTLLHSFASLPLHGGRSVLSVARQIRHDAKLTVSRRMRASARSPATRLRWTTSRRLAATTRALANRALR